MATKQIATRRKVMGSDSGRPVSRWWTLNKMGAAKGIQANIEFWRQNQSWRTTQYVRSARLYGNLPAHGLVGSTASRYATMRMTWSDRHTHNVVQPCVDTLTSKIAKAKPKPEYVTINGDYKAQRKAKDLTTFVGGVFYDQKTYALGRLILRDAEIWGDAFLHVFEKDGRVAHERVPASELWIDEAEALLTEPQQIHRVKTVDRSVLLDLFPDRRMVIESAQPASFETVPFATLADLVQVVESWHLASKEGEADGAHVITVDGQPLTDLEPYSHTWFPFARLSFCPNPHGYWSRGLAELLQNTQTEINRICWAIQESLIKGGTFSVWVKTGSKVAIDQLDNRIGAILRSDEPPQRLVQAVVPPELYTQLQQLKQDAFDLSGVSQLSATSEKPAGLDSAIAMRTYQDIGTERFMAYAQAYEEFMLEVARLTISTVQDIVASKGDDEDKSYVVKQPNRNSLTKIDWKDIALDDDEDFILQCFPVSSLPSDPAGKLSTVQDYLQAGILTPDEGRALLDFVDLDRVESLWNSSRDYLAKILDEMVDDGTYTAPEPFDDLQLAHKTALRYYQRGKVQRLSESRLDLLRQFIADVVELIGKAAPAPANGPAPANPMPTPQSQLLPNTNGPPMQQAA
jgi:hypothetical protein